MRLNLSVDRVRMVNETFEARSIMPPDVVGGLVALLGIISVGALALVGMRMRFRQKLESRDAQELDRVHDALDALQEQNRVLHEEIVELQDRLDFQERLLTRPARERVDTPP